MYFLKDTNEEIKLGGTLTGKAVITTKQGHTITTNANILITNEVLRDLLNAGLVVEKVETVTKTLEDYVVLISERLGWKPQQTANILYRLSSHYPLGIISILFKEIAIDLDKQYKGHILDSEELWMFNTGFGIPMPVKRQEITETVLNNLKNAALFRNKKDVELAMSIGKDVLDPIYGNK